MGDVHLANAKIFKAFCDETRLMALEHLRGGEKCACVLLEKVDVGQSTLSHHMKILVESGVVSARSEGKWTYYSINKAGSEYAALLLKQLTTVAEDGKNDDNSRCCE
jgi:ArsR family transcriptional regulator